MRARLFALMVLRGSVYASLSPFLSVLLIRAGLPLELLGPLSGVGAVITLVAAPFWGRVGDLHGRRRVMAMTMAISGPVLLLFTLDSLAVTIAANLAWAFLSSSYVTLGDSLTLDRLGGERSAYSQVRVGASAGWIATAVVIGTLISRSPLGWDAPGYVGIFLATATAATLAIRLGGELRSGHGVAWGGDGAGGSRRVRASRLRGRPADVGVGGAGMAARAERVPSTREQLRRHWRYLAGMIGVWAAVNAPGVFVGPRVMELGGSGLEVGLATAAGSIVELPGFYLMPVVLGLAGPRRTFILGALLTCVSSLSTALVPSASLVIVARVLAGLGFAWVAVPSLAAIAAAGGPRERASLTGLNYAMSAAGTLLVALVGLPLVGSSGDTSSILVATSLLAPVGAALAVAGWPRPAASFIASAQTAELVPERSAEAVVAVEAGVAEESLPVGV